MSYDIHLFRTETKEKELISNDESFFENDSNLEPFTKEQLQELSGRLISYAYIPAEETESGRNFVHEEYGTALLTDRGLYFSTSFDEDSIFEVGMTASEFTDSGGFEKFDPQNGGWEEL